MSSPAPLAPGVAVAAATAARDAVLAVPGVAGLDRGRFGEVALLLPGTRVEGLRPSSRGARKGLETHIVFDVHSGLTVQEVARDARAAILSATDVAFVDVVVADAR